MLTLEFALYISCVTEISNFKVEIIRQENVLTFDISVAQSFLMNCVESSEELVEQVSGYRLRERCLVNNVVKERILLRQLQHDIVS